MENIMKLVELIVVIMIMGMLASLAVHSASQIPDVNDVKQEVQNRNVQINGDVVTVNGEQVNLGEY
jgi:hypothetical protein